MTAQLELDLFEQPTHKHACVPEQFHVGDYAIVSGLCHDGYYLWERCYVHEVLPDGYRVEICEGLVWGRPWSKDGTMITVSKIGLSRYDAETHYSLGAHWVPSIEDIMKRKHEYDTHSILI